MRHAIGILLVAFSLALSSQAGAQNPPQAEAKKPKEPPMPKPELKGDTKTKEPICTNPSGWDGYARVFTPQCSPYALGNYGGHRCYVTIDRSRPVSPQNITVPPGTKVCVALINPRPTESVLFTPSFANVAAPDLASTFIPSLSPLQSLGFAAAVVFPREGEPADFDHAILPVGLNEKTANSFLKLATAERVRAFWLIKTKTGNDLLAGLQQPMGLLTAKPSSVDDQKLVVDAFSKIGQNSLNTLSKAVDIVSTVHGFIQASLTQQQRVLVDFQKALDDKSKSEGDKAASDQDLINAKNALIEWQTPNKNPSDSKSLPDEDSLSQRFYSLSNDWFTYLQDRVNQYCVENSIPLVIGPEIDNLKTEIAKDVAIVASAATAANCFSQYNDHLQEISGAGSFISFGVDGSSGERNVTICDPQWMSPQSDLKILLQSTFDKVDRAAKLHLAQGEISRLTTIITDGLKQCAQQTEGDLSISPSASPGSTQKPGTPISPGDCQTLKTYNNDLAEIQAVATTLATEQSSLQQVEVQMETLPTKMDAIVYELPITGQFQKGYTSGTVSVTTQSLVPGTAQPTPTTVASVPITFGAGRWRTFSTSTGTAFMLGKAANYSLQQQATVATNSPGTPPSTGSLCPLVAQGAGSSPPSTYCVVNSPSSSPQILAPVVYAHYLLFGAKTTPFQVGLHLTGGVGLDLSPANKSATFLAGASLQLGSVMITPAVSFFEDQRLGGGYNTTQIYTSAGSLPTNVVWPKKFSIGISYVIPSLSAASPASPASSPAASPGGAGAGGSGNQSGSGGGGGSGKPHH